MFGHLFAALGVTIPVGFVEVPSDPAQMIEGPIAKIAAHYRLGPAEAALARRGAAGFAYLGMCRGADLSDIGSIQMILGADPAVPYQAAALAMLGIYTRAAFGRQQSSTCAKAFEDATAK